MPLHILAVDCCEHTLERLETVPTSKLTSAASTDKTISHPLEPDVDLIVIGVSCYPVRRLFISQLRLIYPEVPMLILRRIDSDDGSETVIRGEFILSEETSGNRDLEFVGFLRRVLPIQPCVHVLKGTHFDTVREVIRLIYENYSNPNLDLSRVASELPMPTAHLSRILNRQVGVSFRQLLKNTRIEEAKRMLASRKYSVKEVAARVGFSDSHYFSRSFKELTGQTASEYRATDSLLG